MERVLPKLLRSRRVVCIFISALVLTVVILLRWLGVLEGLELAAYDGFVRLRHTVSSTNPRITIIEVSERDIQEQGRWPLTDGMLADALNGRQQF